MSNSKHDDAVLVDPSAVDYEALWAHRWGDLQRYGPTSRHQRRIIARLLDQLSFESVLDVGCGEGSLLAFIRERFPGRRYAGVDISEAAIDRAKQIMPDAAFYVGEIAPELVGGSYDLVTCIDVVEHIVDDVAFLEGIASVARRYVLCMSVQGRMRPGEEEIGHVRNYERGELQAKMERVGLRPVRIVEWGFPFFSPLFRSAVAGTGAEEASYGRYGLGKRLLCHSIYGLFLLNSWSRGDKIFVLAEKR